MKIPEVRTLLRRLEAKWRCWAFFFNQIDEMDAALVVAALQRAFDGMNMIFDRFGFPEHELEKMSGGLVEVLQQAGMA